MILLHPRPFSSPSFLPTVAILPYFSLLYSANSSYGYTLLKKHQYYDQKVAIGSKQMIRWATSPRLKRFRLLGNDCLLASLSKQSVKFDSLYFAGKNCQFAMYGIIPNLK